MIRKPIVAGRFYSDDKDMLLGEIEKSFSSDLGPGQEPNSDAIGVICPHAGYMFSGPAAACSYNAIAGSKINSFLILGFSHSGIGDHQLSMSKQDWQTPLGIAKYDSNLAASLSDIAGFDDDAHEHEHSIEVQLPFLQYVFKKVKFVAMSVRDDCDFVLSGRKIAEAIKQEKVCVIASSDFTHFGSSYGYVPFHDEIRKNIKNLDMGAVKFIEKLDSAGFTDYISRTHATICGRAPIALQIEIMKKLGAKAKLLKYYTSADIMHDEHNSVSYVSLAYHQ